MFSSVCKGHTVRAKMEAVVSRENPEKQTRDNENAFFWKRISVNRALKL